MALSLPAVSPFDVQSESANVGTRWEKWMNSFKLYLAASGVREASRKRALLLHLAGPDVQDIFFTLEGTGDDADYDGAVNKLNEYFTPKKNDATLRRREKPWPLCGLVRSFMCSSLGKNL